mgnify:CR=1 FL=1|jgi:hypothetical protein
MIRRPAWLGVLPSPPPVVSLSKRFFNTQESNEPLYVCPWSFGKDLRAIA